MLLRRRQLAIALPSQSIAQTKDSDTPTTKRKLTFDDLVAQLRHYNSGTRKGAYTCCEWLRSIKTEAILDAILGLRELLDGYPTLLQTHLTSLVSNCTRLVADEVHDCHQLCSSRACYAESVI